MAKRGGELLSSMLGNLVGAPLTVHDNPELRDEDDQFMDSAAELTPEMKEVMDAPLNNHYRQTLDETVPMLNDQTPRACAADPALRNDVIGWLKTLENMNQRSPQAAYDFGWIWDELDLPRD